MLDNGGAVQRLDRVEMHDGDVDIIRFEQIGGLEPVGRHNTRGHQHDWSSVRRFAHRNGLSDLESVFSTADDRIAAFGEVDINRAFPIQ
jgi:hypothetical protein